MTYFKVMRMYWKVHMAFSLIGSLVLIGFYCAMAFLFSGTIPIILYLKQYVFFAISCFFISLFITYLRLRK